MTPATMRRTALGALAALCTGFAAPAYADDAATLESCVAADGSAPASCIGAIADPCLAPTQRSTLDIVECTNREAAAWDTLLNRWYGAVSARADKSAARLLRDAQRAWIQFRDADCEFAYAWWGDGSMRSIAAGACLRDRTAARALQIHELLGEGG